MRTTEYGDRAARPEEVTRGVGCLTRLAERTDGNDVDILWKLFDQIFEARVAHERYIVPQLLTPHSQNLRHDARTIGVHNARPQSSCRTLRYEINYSHAQLAFYIELSDRGNSRRIGLPLLIPSVLAVQRCGQIQGPAFTPPRGTRRAIPLSRTHSVFFFASQARRETADGVSQRLQESC